VDAKTYELNANATSDRRATCIENLQSQPE
jgi:hypothetical protein